VSDRPPTLGFAEYAPDHLDGVIQLWRDAFEHGVGVHDPNPLSVQREHFVSRILPTHQVTLALLGSELAGFIAHSAETVAQLHVKVGLHRQGVGSALLDLAKVRSSGSLWLYTFARNVVACRFYEKHGFTVVERGFEETWQLEDVKYAWSRGA
jgi:ribosomal protein S18 acetylase RimI-like enzyme